MALKEVLRKFLPSAVLDQFRSWKKNQRRRQLRQQALAGKGLTKAELLQQLQQMGIAPGDTVMVHCSMSQLGFVQGGPTTLCGAFLEAIGPTGHLLMPSSPIKTLQLAFARHHQTVDLRTIPSAMGALSETFRAWPGVKRSPHPTEPVLAWGQQAAWLTEGHRGQITPYNANSPYRRMMQLNGKILYAGVTLDNAGTHLHTLEDAVDFPYPVYHPQVFRFQLTDQEGHQETVETKVHNPVWSVQRRCDELIPMFERASVLDRFPLGQAECLLLNAQGMLNTMLEAFHERRVTMYHPQGQVE